NSRNCGTLSLRVRCLLRVNRSIAKVISTNPAVSSGGKLNAAASFAVLRYDKEITTIAKIATTATIMRRIHLLFILIYSFQFLFDFFAPPQDEEGLGIIMCVSRTFLEVKMASIFSANSRNNIRLNLH